MGILTPLPSQNRSKMWHYQVWHLKINENVETQPFEKELFKSLTCGTELPCNLHAFLWAKTASFLLKNPTMDALPAITETSALEGWNVLDIQKACLLKFTSWNINRWLFKSRWHDEKIPRTILYNGNSTNGYPNFNFSSYCELQLYDTDVEWILEQTWWKL